MASERSTVPWDELRLSQVEDVARHCNDACSTDAVSLIAEVRVLTAERDTLRAALELCPFSILSAAASSAEVMSAMDRHAIRKLIAYDPTPATSSSASADDGREGK